MNDRLKSYLDWVLRTTPKQPFRPYLFYDDVSDELECCFCEEASEREQVLPGFNLLRRIHDKRDVVGVVISNVSQLLLDERTKISHEEIDEGPDRECPWCETPFVDGHGSSWLDARCPTCDKRVDWDDDLRCWKRSEKKT